MRRTLIVMALAAALVTPAGVAQASPSPAKKTQTVTCDFTGANAVLGADLRATFPVKGKEKCTVRDYTEVKSKDDKHGTKTETKIHYKEKRKYSGRGEKPADSSQQDRAKSRYSCDFTYTEKYDPKTAEWSVKAKLSYKDRLDVRLDGDKQRLVDDKLKVKFRQKHLQSVAGMLQAAGADTCHKVAAFVRQHPELVEQDTTPEHACELADEDLDSDLDCDSDDTDDWIEDPDSWFGGGRTT